MPLKQPTEVDEKAVREMFDFFSEAVDSSLIDVVMILLDNLPFDNAVRVGTLATIIGAYIGHERDDLIQLENDAHAIANIVLKSAIVYRNTRLKLEKETSPCH